MKQTVLITGANGFVAKYLAPKLQQNYNVKLLTRTPNAPNEYRWDLENFTMDENALNDVDYIVHLAGARFNDDSTPLTEELKKLILDTRVGAANFLREKLQARNQKIKSFVSASAIGYYGFTDDTLEIDETGNKGTNFAAEVCDEWEKAADLFKADGVAELVCKVRVPVALGKEDGAFPRFENWVKSNPEAAEQPNPNALPWGHVKDTAGIFEFAVENNLDGVYNSVSPNAASLQDVLKAIANNVAGANHQIQPFSGKHLVSHKIIEAGYTFQYPDIEKAVADIL